MGWFSDFIAAPAKTISATIDTVATNPIISGPVALANTAVQSVTGMTPTEQYATGAAGGAAASALWLASPSAYAATTGIVGEGLAGAGAIIGAGLAGSSASITGATAGVKATAAAAATKAVQDTIGRRDEPKAEAAPVTASTADKNGLPLLLAGVGLLSALI